MSSATVYFEKEEDRVNSSNFSMHYYNSKLKWAELGCESSELISNMNCEDYSMVKRKRLRV